MWMRRAVVHDVTRGRRAVSTFGAGCVVGDRRTAHSALRCPTAGGCTGRRSGGVHSGCVRADQRMCVAAPATVVRGHRPDRPSPLHYLGALAECSRTCTVRCSIDSEDRASWTGRRRSWTRQASGPKGIFDRSQPGRPRQEPVEDPRAVRGRGNSAGRRRLGSEHPRQHHAAPDARSHSRGQVPPWTATPQTRSLRADKGYDSAAHLCWLRERRIVPRIARHGIDRNDRLGRHRWKIALTTGVAGIFSTRRPRSGSRMSLPERGPLGKGRVINHRGRQETGRLCVTCESRIILCSGTSRKSGTDMPYHPADPEGMFEISRG